VKLGSVLSDVFGVSGQLILEALLEGKAAPEQMAELAQKKAWVYPVVNRPVDEVSRLGAARMALRCHVRTLAVKKSIPARIAVCKAIKSFQFVL